MQHKLIARDLHIGCKHELKADECLVWILNSSHENRKTASVHRG